MDNLQNPIHGNRYLSWILRGLLFLVAMFFMLFSFDVFSMDGTFLQKLGGLRQTDCEQYSQDKKANRQQHADG